MATQVILLSQEDAASLRAATAGDPNNRIDPVDVGDGVFVLSIECADDPAFTKYAATLDEAMVSAVDTAIAAATRYDEVKAEFAADVAADAAAEVVSDETPLVVKN